MAREIRVLNDPKSDRLLGSSDGTAITCGPDLYPRSDVFVLAQEVGSAFLKQYQVPYDERHIFKPPEEDQPPGA